MWRRKVTSGKDERENVQRRFVGGDGSVEVWDGEWSV